jgi:hypothetical protein
MPRNPFAKGQVDALRMVDEEAQGLGPRLLEGNEVKLGIELCELLLNAVFEVFHAFSGRKCLIRGEKKVGQAHFSMLH